MKLTVISLFILFIVGQLFLCAALFLAIQSSNLFGVICASVPIIINFGLAFLASTQLLKPLKSLTDTNSDAKSAKTALLYFSIDDAFSRINDVLHTSLQTKEESLVLLQQDHETIEAIEQDIQAISSYTEIMVAVDEELGFQPELIENAFAQSISAADYATSTFEQIYMSINALGEGYDKVRNQSLELQENAQTASSQVETTKENVAKLSLAANEINEVTKSISDIASMTQLLALNASIEAARAGESGRGFAVVADEVKKLASQTNQATERISEISNGILSSSQESEVSIEKINNVTDEINTTISVVFSEIENQWGDVQDLLGKMGQAAGTVSGLKGILMTSDVELKGHFTMLEGVYQFAKESSKTITQLSNRLNIPSDSNDDTLPEQNEDKNGEMSEIEATQDHHNTQAVAS